MSRKTILLVYPYHRYFYLEYPWLPSASIFLASTLLDAGYKVIIVDDRFSREETLENIAEHIEDTVLIGFTTVSGSQLKNTVELIQWIRRDYDVPIVLGGSFPSAEPEMCLRDLPINYVIVGQGEYSLLKLANFLTGKGSKEEISNLYWKDAQDNIGKSSQKLERVNINSLPPLPYFNKEVISVERYLNPENRVVNYNTSDPKYFCRSNGLPTIPKPKVWKWWI
ncbi:cobalamin-dependent protein [Chloroflexota bacterium]